MCSALWTYLKDINQLHHIRMALALFEKTDFRRTVDPFRHNFDGIFRSGSSVNTSSANAKTAVAKYGFFEVDFITLKEGRILQKEKKYMIFKKKVKMIKQCFKIIYLVLFFVPT